MGQGHYFLYKTFKETRAFKRTLWVLNRSRLSPFSQLSLGWIEETVPLRKRKRTWEHGCQFKIDLNSPIKSPQFLVHFTNNIWCQRFFRWPHPHNACQNVFNICLLSNFVSELSKITQKTRTIYNPFTPLHTLQRSSRNAAWSLGGNVYLTPSKNLNCLFFKSILQPFTIIPQIMQNKLKFSIA